MRILLPTIRDPGQIGGTTTHITMLIKGLAENGEEAAALYLGEQVPDLLRRAGVIWPAGALNRLHPGWGMIYAAKMRGWLLGRLVQEELAWAGKPWDVLNAQEVYAVPYLREIAEAAGVPLVLTLHGYPLYESISEGYVGSSELARNFLRQAEMQALRLADAVVTVDTRLYRHVLRLVPERKDRVYSLMNFVDTAVFAAADPDEEARIRQELRKRWDIPAERVVLFCPRRLVKKNGVVYPALALATMEAEERRRFLLLYAGEGGERAEIERIVRTHGLEPNVRLLGGQDRAAILELYRAADIVLVPSVHSENVEEATSLSALEAMASGRPLIAGNVGGLAEMVVDGETGLLVPADPKALAAAILRLAAAPDLGARLAAAARKYVVEKHSHIRAAAAYAEIYQRARQGLRQAGWQAARQGASRPPWPSISVLGFPLDVVTLDQAAQWVISAAADAPGGASALRPGGGVRGQTGPGRTLIAVSFNPELVIRAQSDPAAAEVLCEADLSYPDGVGAAWAARRQGARPTPQGAVGGQVVPQRVAGIDLAERVLELAAERGLPVYFLGAAPGVAETAARRQAERFPGLRVVGAHHGYFSQAEEDAVVEAIRESGARILLVAMGAPRQEAFLLRHRDRLGAAVGLGLGGSFDVWAGTVKRAPAWTQRAKVEWLYRLARDPRRIRRQAVLPRFATQVLRWCPEDYGPPRRGSLRNRYAPNGPGGEWTDTGKREGGS